MESNSHNPLTTSQLRNESLLDDDVFNRSDSSDNLDRADTRGSSHQLRASQLEQQPPVQQINMEEFIQQRLRGLLE